MTVEGYKLDFVGFAISINMDNGTDIARLEAVRRQGLGEDHSVVFFNHGRNISQWVGTDQPRPKKKRSNHTEDHSGADQETIEFNRQLRRQGWKVIRIRQLPSAIYGYASGIS